MHTRNGVNLHAAAAAVHYYMLTPQRLCVRLRC